MDQQVAADDALAALSAADPKSRVKLALGGELAVKRWGRGTPIVCLHAVGHGSGDFDQLQARLGDGFEVIAIDWPGMGRSPPNDMPLRAGWLAGLLLEAVDALALRRPFVIGNSIGGTAAIIAAAQEPQRFAGLVLCNPGGLSALDPVARFAIGRMAAFFRAGERGAWWFPWAFAAYYRRLVLPRRPARARREQIVRAHASLAPLLADAWAGFGEPSSDLRCLAPRLNLPVWLAWARGDQFVSWRRAKSTVAAMPSHRVTLLRGGHSAFLEDPDAFVRGLRSFVHDVQSGRFP